MILSSCCYYLSMPHSRFPRELYGLLSGLCPSLYYCISLSSIFFLAVLCFFFIFRLTPFYLVISRSVLRHFSFRQAFLCYSSIVSPLNEALDSIQNIIFSMHSTSFITVILVRVHFLRFCYIHLREEHYEELNICNIRAGDRYIPCMKISRFSPFLSYAFRLCVDSLFFFFIMYN